MYFKKFVLICVICFAVTQSGCIPFPYVVSVLSNDFEGYKIYRIVWNDLPGIPFLDPKLSLIAQRFETKSGLSRYSLIMEYTSSSWIFIPSGESLKLNIDGTIIKFFSKEGSSDHREVNTYGSVSVTEKAWYDISSENLALLANAKKVRIQLDGKNTFLERDLSDSNINNFKKFYDEQVVNHK